MKIKTPALQRVRVATRYRRDYILADTTFDLKVKRNTKTAVYSLQPTTVTVLDYDFKATKRLKATAASAALVGLTVAIPFLYTGVGLYLVGRDLFRSVGDHIRDGYAAAEFMIGVALDGLRTRLGAIVNP
jgi:hypothetical protein